jgi:hypothetical protein
MDGYQYEAACKAAADDQGITAMIAALASRGVTAHAYQSGGFCMLALVSLDGGADICATTEGACYYEQGQSGVPEEAEYIPFVANEGDSEQQRIDAIADGVAAFIARMKGAQA